ncbi:MAG: hypothetical protein CSA39_04600 [Flavobacteriales bacterium]|nr:MAG: hypothetical protein CSA39_04600 [Flavobacteriales bacterium]
MQGLKNLFKFYVFGNFHVGLSTFCLVKITLLTYGEKANVIPLFVGLATVMSYNLIRIKEHKKLQPWFYEFFLMNKKAILLSVMLCSVIVLYLFTFLTVDALLSLIPIMIFTFFYSMPIRLHKNAVFTLRSVAFLKLFLIAVSWAVVTVIFPLIQYQISIGFNELIITIQRFLLIAAITIPFDIRDVEYDSTAIHTLPATMGVANAKRLALLFLMLFLGSALFLKNAGKNNLQIHLMVVILSAILILRTRKGQSVFYTAYWVEAIPVFWLIVFLLFNHVVE